MRSRKKMADAMASGLLLVLVAACDRSRGGGFAGASRRVRDGRVVVEGGHLEGWLAGSLASLKGWSSWRISWSLRSERGEWTC